MQSLDLDWEPPPQVRLQVPQAVQVPQLPAMILVSKMGKIISGFIINVMAFSMVTCSLTTPSIKIMKHAILSIIATQ